MHYNTFKKLNNRNNHNLVLLKDESSKWYNLYKCTVCDYKLINYTNNPNIWITNNTTMTSNYLSCEELVMKNIIE